MGAIAPPIKACLHPNTDVDFPTSSACYIYLSAFQNL
ncbi:hypothetical protein B6N60_04430 [Richelia sinica FACHB-800]|uniref:Uncharacterized protein n=1 Tax=Richelia sinica FACHB-800 TaxID=1357546 RepID=A0A975Y6W6_9NOST|nr:hypothetical protein B6N60_04430 [Richelia sinica FACHB-800]